MSILSFLVWVILAYGLSNILVYSALFATPRELIRMWGESEFAPFNSIGKFLTELLSCIMCTSTWVGFFLGLVFYSPTNIIFETPIWYSWFFDGLLASGAVWSWNTLVEHYEK